MARDLQRQRQAYGAGADDDDGVLLRARMLRGQPGLVHLVLVVDRAPGLGVGLVHVASFDNWSVKKPSDLSVTI